MTNTEAQTVKQTVKAHGWKTGDRVQLAGWTVGTIRVERGRLYITVDGEDFERFVGGSAAKHSGRKLA